MNIKLPALFVLLCMLPCIALRAQVDITLGTATTANVGSEAPCPLQDYLEGTRAQYLFTAAELNAAGMQAGTISGIKFTVNALGSFSGKIEEYAIRMGTTNVSTLNQDVFETIPATNLYGPVDYIPAVGVNTFTFATPFIWDGRSNLIVEVCNGAANNATANTYSSNPFVTYTTGFSFNASHTYRANNLGNLCGTTGVASGTATTRPNIIFTYTTAPACSGAPVAGAAVSSVTTICPNTTFLLGLTGASVATGLSYQWQNSVNNISWANIPGATNAVLNTQQSTSAYYRCVVSCNNGGASNNSASVYVTVPPVAAGNFTINSAVATGGNNFQSFAEAYSYIKCGINGPVVFDVVAGSGPYNEQLIMAPVAGASAINTITFNGNGATIKYSSSNSNERAVIKLNGADHVRFNNLTIDATGTSTTYGYGVQLINDADSNTVRNCSILCNKLAAYSNSYAGIVINSSASSATTMGATLCDSNSIVNNTITGGYAGVTVIGSNTDAIMRNLVQGNTLKDGYNYGVYVAGSFSTIISRNDISRPALTSPGDFYGVWVSSLNTNMLVSGNRIHDPFTAAPSSTNTFYGIYHSNSDAISGLEHKIYNNLIYRVNGAGAQYGIYNNGSDYTLYYHNTISLDDINSTSANVTRAYYQNTQAIGIQLFNNIITVTRGGTGTKHVLYRSTNITSDSLNKNDYYISALNSALGFYNNVNYYTLATWKAGALQDAASFAYNPLYKDTVNGNYMPTSLVLDNRGEPLSVAADITSAVRSASTPDLGAYEFSLPPCNTSPIAGTSVATPNSGVCLSTSVQLNLAGNTTGSGQSVQWQYATAAAGPYSNAGGALPYPDTAIYAPANGYYQAVLTCGGNTATSVPVRVTVNPGIPAGLYTINPGAAVSATNFQTIGAAVKAMECGIGGAVTFDIYPGTYNEQVRINAIAGAGANSRITFRSLTGNAGSVVITSAAAATLTNYVLQLDSAAYITFKNVSITSTNTTFSRAVDIANLAAHDSILNCIITVPAATSTANTSAGIFSNAGIGSGNAIVGNTITGGANGIYFAGVSATVPTADNTIAGNTISGTYYYGIYAAYNKRILIAGNTVAVATPANSATYGIYATYCDTAYQVTGNNITISNITGNAYGLFVNYCRSSNALRGIVNNNKIIGVNNNTGGIYGFYQSFSIGNNSVNNVVNIKTAGAIAYGIYSNNDNDINYWNNTVQNASASTAATNVAAYFDHNFYYYSVQLRNNIFSHTGGNKAMTVTGYSFVNSDYNMLYSSGSTLINSTVLSAAYTSLSGWQQATGWDINSISFQPAFTNSEALQPDVNNENVWAMHGRGVQLPANTSDFNNNSRPAVLQAGVPDLGAYEFVPVSEPVALTATPATPAAGTTQTFTLGTDVVARITWPTGALVPPSLTLRRYSGVLPAGIPSANSGMYFYLSATNVAAGNYQAVVEQHYVPSWLGFIPDPGYIKTGKTIAGGNWTVTAESVVDTMTYTFTDTAVTQLDKFTGLSNGKVAVTIPDIVYNSLDSTNRGQEFWLPYGNTLPFKTNNNQELLLYLSAEKEAHVTVSVNGTAYSKTYTVAANSVTVTQNIPKAGANDARLLTEGLYNRGIHVTSDAPVAVFAAQYIPQGETGNAAAMLLPVGTYGYDYTSINLRQRVFSSYDVNPGYSWVNVIASHDSTVVKITPANPTVGGRAAGVPFTVMLQKGQVYQVLGAVINDDPTLNSHDESYDLTGTRVLSVANESGNCYPIAVFSGSSHDYFGCGPILPLTGDNYIQQNFPTQAWGREYLTAPVSGTAGASGLLYNIYRIAVKDVATVVKRNGTVLTGLVVPGNYYEYTSNTADHIEADQPVTVAQVTPANLSCGNSSGDVEVIYLSAVTQSVAKALVPRMMHSATTQQNLTLIVPTAALSSLQVDGSSTFDYTYAHPNMSGYTVVVKQWTSVVSGSAVITCDQPFTGISYGYGFLNNYVYNVGMRINSQEVVTSISNTLNSTATATSAYTCARAPFRPTISVPLLAEEITWKFSALAGATPGNDVVLASPAPVASYVKSGLTYYTYTLAQDCSIAAAGEYVIPVIVKHSSLEGCSKTLTYPLNVLVKDAPVADFTATPAAVCAGKSRTLDASSVADFTINRWNWIFSDNTTASGEQTSKAFVIGGTQYDTLRIISIEGCVDDTVKAVTIYEAPAVALVADEVNICPNETGTLQINNPETGVIYNWFTVATDGTAVGSGTSHNVTATGVYYAEATSAQGCISLTRAQAEVTIYEALAAPVVKVDSAGVTFVHFSWEAVPGAVSYEVSTDGGATYHIPSSGATGLTHTVSPLAPMAQVTLLVRANGAVSCVQGVSVAVSGQALPDQVYVPNAFTPNNDGLNDTWQVYGYSFNNMRVLVFNQWGGKVFEGTGKQTNWDGSSGGKPQPSGVYMYVIELTMNDGSKQNKKGSINLVR
ncbi:gliding motility-associated C-terminal domain-containing protein [Filimonas lacunae]|uniref:Gliding motility-associated C-terminal domain-containing protein n=1 Tax=Filimonas lacunae TaxID=477680 RepID=A0A173MI33_9BACT|nr:gliding motility-associated C-terminal domain-containing protein [Filimonas lacunae]BAV07159.1 CHU large protein [Filimonas lacunae]SIS94103.1 gliding motility-associated C-terminal domain-containing protein [Filimonas lacunae]